MTSPVAVLAHDRRIAEALLEISYAVGSVMEIDDILQRICEIGARVMETKTCSIYLLEEEEPDMLVLRASQGLSRAQELGLRGFRLGEGVPGWAAQNNQTVTLRNDQKDPRWARLDDTPREATLKAYLCTPLRIQDEVVGIITFRREYEHDWTQEEVIFAEFIAKQVAIVLEKARLYWQKVEAERLAAIAISLSEVAHYIKNLLQNVVGGSYFVDKGLRGGDLEKARQGWTLLQRSIGKIRSLVENMLMYSREKRCELDLGNLNALVADLASEVEEAASQRRITLNVSLASELPLLMLDGAALNDALLNLISNAMDAIPAGREGHVEIRTELDAEARVARVHVRDDGMGIAPEAHQKLFNLFFSTKGHGGTGIGLAVTRKIIEEHNGRITFQSTQGEGTTFTVELPLPPR